MRDYKTIIQEAELLAMSPDSVAEFLKKRAKQKFFILNNPYFDDDADLVDEETEMSLHRRSDQLIDLSLTKYARFIGTLRYIFQNSQQDSALRLAVLSNSTKLFFESEFNGHGGSRFPKKLFSDNEQFVHFITEEASPEEVLALFMNPMIDELFLRDLLERKNPWDTLSDQRLMRVVLGLGNNERMWTPYDGGSMPDGYAHAQHNDVFNAAWKLAEIVEPSKTWAVLLSQLYARLSTDTYSIKEPLQLINRWRLDLSKPELAKEETKNNDFGCMSDYQGVRKGLAKLALRQNNVLLPQLLSSPDIALRAAAYAYGYLTPEQLSSAYQQDGGHFIFKETINNASIWHNPKCRDVLENANLRLFNEVQEKIAGDDNSIEARVKRIESNIVSSAQDIQNLKTTLDDLKSGMMNLAQEALNKIEKVNGFINTLRYVAIGIGISYLVIRFGNWLGLWKITL